ncbi:MAG: hypothetical protein CYG61_10560 [Actinobacteria bacterium]|nr:MAG: hypothetical protein CYG61_10560 [Actinomycetota bacterium]
MSLLRVPAELAPVLAAGGIMGQLTAAKDWASTPFGPAAQWPQSLRTALSVCLESRFPMILWWGPELCVLYNDAYIPIFGDKHPDVLGRPGIEVWGEVWDVIGPRLTKVLERGEASWSDDEPLFPNRFGFEEEAFFTYSYSPIRVESGKVGGVFTAVAETTPKVLSARRLAVLREMGGLSGSGAGSAEEVCAAAAAVLVREEEDVPFAAVYLLDGQGRARLAGRAGREPEHLPLEVSAGEDSGRWPLATAASNGLLQGADANGFPCPIEEVGSGHPGAVLMAVGAGAGPATAVLVAGVSPRRRFDEAHRDFLGLAVGHLANAIADVRAYEAERRRATALEELDQAKTAFFQNVSHEFRTPLTLMLGPLEDLAQRGEALPGDALAQVTLARSNAERLLKLVNSLLDFSRLSSGGLPATYRPVDLAQTTADLAATFRSAIEQAGLSFVVDCPPLPGLVYVDRGMWETIVLNLLSNALKFTFAGSISVRLSAKSDGVELTVSDTGEGVAAEDIPQLFTRFHRVRGAKARTFEGSGIGLAMVAELAGLHGGTVGVHSERHHGSTFTVSIPFGSAHLAPAKVAEEPAEVGAGGGAEPFVKEALWWLGGDEASPAPVADGGSAPRVAEQRTSEPTSSNRPRILVADDNADMRAYLVRMLDPAYEVEAVPNGEEALRAAQERPPDLVLTDVMMPGLDGLGLVRALRAGPNALLPIVMLSARAGEESAAEGLAEGADDYLVKPFSAGQLLAKVRSSLELAEARVAEVRRREEESDRFFNLSLDLMAIAGFDGYLKRVNPAYERVLGWSEQELLTRPYVELVHPEDRGAVAAELEALASGRGTVTFELRLLTKDGGYRWFRASANPAPDDGLIYAVGLDITERKRAESLLAADATVLEHIARGEPLAVVLDMLARMVESQAPGMLASVLLVDDAGTRLRHGAAPSLPEAYNRAIDGIEIGPAAGSCGTAAHRGSAVVVAEIANNPLWADFRDLAATHGLAACWSTPIRAANGEVLGTFALYYRRPRAPEDAEIGLIEAATHLARTAIEHARDERFLRAREAQLAESQRMAHLGSWELDVASMAMNWSDELFAILGFQPGAVAPSAEALLERIPPPDREAVEIALATALADTLPFSLEHRIVRPDGEERLLHAMVRIEADAEGNAVRAFGTNQDVTERKLMQEALHQQRALYRHEREIAQSLQRSLLPDTEVDLPGLAVATRYLPGSEGMEVGGDWYDVFPLPTGAIAFAVGDIVGRGLSAAATMGQLRAALRAYALEHPSPSSVIGHLSHLVENLGQGEMATLAYGVYEPATRSATLACAGHPPPLLVGRHGEVGYVEEGRWPPLGVSTATGSETEVSLEGSALVLYTDGLIERRTASLDDGLAALARAASAGSTEPEELCDRVLTALLDPDGVDDDVALLVLAPTPLGADGFRMAMAAEPSVLKSLRQVLAGWLDELGASPEERSDIVLACNEAASNVIEHAYGPEEGQLEVAVQAEGDTLAISIRDFGTWRAPGRGGGGRGLSIMEALMDSVEVAPRDRGNELRLTRRLGKPPPAPTTPLLGSSVVRNLPANPVATAVPVVRLAEEVDLSSAASVETELTEALDNDALGLVVDLSQTRYLDSAALRILFNAALRLRTRRQHLRLVVPDASPVARLLSLTDPGGLLPISASKEQATEEIHRASRPSR